MRRRRGFTLLELLVALAVFALTSVLAYSGLRSVLAADAANAAATARLGQLQVALTLLGRDLDHLLARPWRDEFGYWQPALYHDPGATRPRLDLIRGGARSLAGSTLARVAWELEGGVLYRLTWAQLDGAGARPAARRPVLGEPDAEASAADALTVAGAGLRVERLAVRFVVRGETGPELLEAWPPPRTPAGTAPLPDAVEVVLEVAPLGRVRRLFAVQG